MASDLRTHILQNCTRDILCHAYRFTIYFWNLVSCMMLRFALHHLGLPFAFHFYRSEIVLLFNRRPWMCTPIYKISCGHFHPNPFPPSSLSLSIFFSLVHKKIRLVLFGIETFAKFTRNKFNFSFHLWNCLLWISSLQHIFLSAICRFAFAIRWWKLTRAHLKIRQIRRKKSVRKGKVERKIWKMFK